MAFTRENQIRNYSIPLVEDLSTVAATYFITNCQTREMQYTQMRKLKPAVFEEIQDYMQSIETEQLCTISYKED